VNSVYPCFSGAMSRTTMHQADRLSCSRYFILISSHILVNFFLNLACILLRVFGFQFFMLFRKAVWTVLFIFGCEVPRFGIVQLHSWWENSVQYSTFGGMTCKMDEFAAVMNSTHIRIHAAVTTLLCYLTSSPRGEKCCIFCIYAPQTCTFPCLL
jgi:hypothetical protein